MRSCDPAAPQSSARSKPNAAAMGALVDELKSRMATAALGGDERSREAPQIAAASFCRASASKGCVDPGSPFLELSPLAAFGMYDGDIHAAGIITGIGRVSGRECVIVCNDATIKGGTYYPMTVKKHLRAQEIARENHLPCIYLVDSGGAQSAEPGGDFPRHANISAASSSIRRRCRRAGIPQIASVMGSCTAGGAYVPAMSDETIIVKGQGTIFLGGPPLVKAATGEIVTAEELGGADVHARISGVADHYANDDTHALAIVRRIVAQSESRQSGPTSRSTPRGRRSTIRPS